MTPEEVEALVAKIAQQNLLLAIAHREAERRARLRRQAA